ncbi:MAG TPA: dTDP-4-dehydrorhamnose 3,5-epimerase [Trueperaceae bacterium]|nr:dTDP-4-dehydrorhamnose 3,5-epimerase [Trueperaceae bacterium]
MIFRETPLHGAFVVELEERSDERGFFARTFCAREFAEHGLKPTVAQANVSFNHVQGTLRGMHYQVPPAAETKLIRCTRGAIFDAIIDLRPDSPSYLEHFGVELTEHNRLALYVPEMFAHGYLTLTPGAEVVYQVGEFYTPGYERGIRYDDPAFAIDWPAAIELMSPKDESWPAFDAATAAREARTSPDGAKVGA